MIFGIFSDALWNVADRLRRRSRVSSVLEYLTVTCALITLSTSALLAQNPYEKKAISKIEIELVGASPSAPTIEQYRLTAREAVGGFYSTPRIRDAIAALYEKGLIDTVTVSAQLTPADTVELIFNIKRKTQAGRVSITVVKSSGTLTDTVTEQELLLKLNIVAPGALLTEPLLQSNADDILTYLRERGFYQSKVAYDRQPTADGGVVGVKFTVTPGRQATISSFAINIDGYAKTIADRDLKLRKGRGYSRDRQVSDEAKVREILRKDDFLSPELEETRIRYDDELNTISVAITGKVGPTVKVEVESEGKKVGNSTQVRLLPIKRDGTLDYSAIVEGERRLESYYQEQGYFFANVRPFCSVTPTISDSENTALPNDTELLCQFLGSEELMGHSVKINYRVDLDRRLTLTELRLRGTDKLTIDDIRTVVVSQEANLLGIIPYLGYGRGYTSATILEDDANTIRSLLAELGYRDAQVRVNQGVSLDGEKLIVTFVVEEGPASVISDIEIVDNKAIDTATLLTELPPLMGENYSRARERNAVRKLREYYSNLGYYDAHVTSRITDEPAAEGDLKRDVKLEFKIENEGRKVVIKRILINGLEKTKESFVLKALTLRPGELLRSVDIYTSEQNLYSTDAFSRVGIKAQSAGDSTDGQTRLTDVIIDLEEQPARLLTYGGGASTDVGLSGFFDIRHVNLLGNLWQGGTRVKLSQRQQLVQFDFINPRFIRDGDKRWSPLTLSLQYQRDTSVTRFFRSTFDRGTFGIVQRVDEDGNPIDEFGNNTGSPTINRLALSAETSRTISRKDRSLFFLRYRFEDVRLFNVDSLLIKELLIPDRKTRISGFSATVVRDTRKNCSLKYSVFDLIAKGEPGDPCRYNASDPTNGQYLTADYSMSVPALGANVGFHKFQASYNYYYTFPRLKNTTIAARGIIGLARVFAGGDRYTGSTYPSLNGLLPISERFFAGGANNLRGFEFEEAGPRVVVNPQGTFLNSNGEQVFLEPFTIPFGGNALAVVNIEARIPLTKSIRAVPFYDGGNVFRRAGDIFKRPDAPANDVALQNQRAIWTHTVGLGFRIKTPVGGEFGVDYGRLLNPPSFLIPQPVGPNAQYRLQTGQLHFRFSQAF
ncbi:MAG: POTRA domain-containing protein [Pyrinomonadaceae bacterium]